MTDSTRALRADTERTQQELGRDVDALADKVNPAKMMHRQTSRMRAAVTSMRERVMGVAHDVEDSVSSAVADVTHSAGTHGREGNPLAVGLIAFGVGLLAASLLPASEKEKALAQSAKEQAQPLMHEAGEVAKEVAADLKEPAQDAATAVKDRATDAVETVKQEATDAAGDVKDSAHEAQQNITEG